MSGDPLYEDPLDEDPLDEDPLADTVIRTRAGRRAVTGSFGRDSAPESDDTQAVPGPLRRGVPDESVALAPTSDTLAAHRGQRRRRDSADAVTDAVDALSPTTDSGTVRVPDPATIEQYASRRAAPVVAVRAPEQRHAPEPAYDGESVERESRARARRRALGAAALIAASLVVALAALVVVLLLLR